MHPHLYELDQVNVDIEHNHQDAMRNRDARLVRGTQSNGITLLTMRLRGAVTILGMRLRHRPTVVQDPAAVPTLPDAPAKSVVGI